MSPNRQVSADFLTFNEEIINAKLHFFLQCYVQLSEIKYFMSLHYISRTNSKILTPSIFHWLKLIIVKVDHDSTGIYIHGRFNMIIWSKS